MKLTKKLGEDESKDETYDTDKYWITRTEGLGTILVLLVLGILVYISFDVVKMIILKW